jgi:hypothetical protein
MGDPDGPLLIVEVLPSMTVPGCLVARYHWRSLPPPSAAFLGGSSQLRL